MQRPSGPTNTEGFALIEVMLALAVLGGVVFVTATTLMTSGRVERFNLQRSQVTQLLASQLERDTAAAAAATWTSSGPSGLPSSTTTTVAGTAVTVSLSGGWCEETAAGQWAAYRGYTTPSPPAPPAPGEIDAYSEVIGAPLAWKERATASWGHGQTMRIATLLPTPSGQPVQPTSTGTCPS